MEESVPIQFFFHSIKHILWSQLSLMLVLLLLGWSNSDIFLLFHKLQTSCNMITHNNNGQILHVHIVHVIEKFLFKALYKLMSSYPGC